MKNNGLSCNVMIGEKWWWQRVGGRFGLGPEQGDWAYIDKIGIGLAHTTDTDSPGFVTPGNVIVVLFDVPEGFFNQVKPNQPLAGEGIIRLNNIPLQWEMQFPQ
jgi:hypothetical protein